MTQIELSVDQFNDLKADTRVLYLKSLQMIFFGDFIFVLHKSKEDEMNGKEINQ